MKRWIKGTIIALGSLLTLIILTVSIACYLIFTPERLTGIVNRMASQYLTCDMQVGKIDLTLFSSFPDVSLHLHDVAIINPCSSEVNDTVAAIGECEAVVDIKDLLKENTITLRCLHLDRGTANLYIGSDGKANFMVLATDSTVEEDTANSDVTLPDIDIQEITLNDIDITYHDASAEQRGIIKGCNLALNGQWKEQQLKAAFKGSLEQLTAHIEGETPTSATIRNIAIELDGSLTDDATGKVDGTLSVDHIEASAQDIRADVSDIEWKFGGSLKDKQLAAATTLATQPISIGMEGETPICASLTSITLKAEGASQGAHINLTPTLTVEDLDVWIDKDQMLTQADIVLHTPLLTDTTLSNVNLTDASLSLNQYRIDMEGEVNIQDTTTMDAQLHFNTNRWNIPELLTLVPESYRYLLEGIHIKGNTSLRGSVSGAMKQGEPTIRDAEATLAMNGLDLNYIDSIALQSRSASLAVRYNGDSDRATGSINASNIEAVMTGLADAHMSNLYGSFTLRRVRQITDGYIDAQAKLATHSLSATMDTLNLDIAHPVIDLTMQQASSKAMPHFRATLNSDTLRTAMGHLLAVSTGHLKVSGEATYDALATDMLARWTPRLTFDLHTGDIASPMLTIPFDIPHILFDYADGHFTINDSRIVLGNSDFSLRGNITAIDSFLNKTGLLKAELDFTSDYTDVTQLMDLVSGLGTSDTTSLPQEEPLPAEAVAEEGDPFMVPMGFDVRLNTDITRANVNGFTFENIGGHVTVKDGILVLEEMGFTSDAARMQLTAMYKSPRKDHLFVGFDFHLLDIEVDQLIRMIPDVDSIIPMLKAFDGEAQFHFAAETYLRSNYEPKLSTLRAAGAIEGKDLVVLDNETFSQISKLLLFEKKTENKVDNIGVELAVFRDKVTLYPFLIAMDDYKAVIGGRHNIDNDLSFNYHISLTDTPLHVVRAGLDISGTLDDMKFKLVPCKYAHLYNPEKQNVVQERTLQLKKMISESLKDNVKEQPTRKASSAQ